MLIYAVRHGQTDYNAKRLVQGWSDFPLNSIGITQAIEVGNYFKNKHIPIDYILSSPLKRSIKSAELISSTMHLDLPIHVEPLFIERNFASFEGLPVDDTIKIISQDGFKQDGYEDNDQLLMRIKQAVQKLNSVESKHLLLSVHSHVIKAMLILADEEKYHFLTYLNNASMCIFELKDQKLKVIEYNITAR